MIHPRITCTRAFTAAAIAAVLASTTVGGVSATTEPPITEPAATESATTEPGFDASAAPDMSAAPDASAAPGDTGGVLAETTYPFADGEYHWASDHGTVPRAGGDIELAPGAVTLIATATGVVGVTGGDGTLAEVAEGTAVARAEEDVTVIGAIETSFGSFTTFDIEPGPAPDGGASFTPGAGEQSVTLTGVSIEPGASLDLGTFGADFVYVVVSRGVVDASDGSELVPHGTIAWSADAGPVTLSPRSPNVAAELFVVTVAPAA